MSKKKKKSLPKIQREVTLAQIEYLLNNPEAAGKLTLQEAMALVRASGGRLVLHLDEEEQSNPREEVEVLSKGYLDETQPDTDFYVDKEGTVTRLIPQQVRHEGHDPNETEPDYRDRTHKP